MLPRDFFLQKKLMLPRDFFLQKKLKSFFDFIQLTAL